MIVARYARTISPIVPASVGFAWYTAAKPVISGNQRQMVKPNAWKKGSTLIIRSSAVIQYTRDVASHTVSTLRCESITPFGSPVLPLEKVSDLRQSRRLEKG